MVTTVRTRYQVPKCKEVAEHDTAEGERMVTYDYLAPMIAMPFMIAGVCILFARRRQYVRWLKSLPPQSRWLWGAWLLEDQIYIGITIACIIAILFCTVFFVVYIAESFGAEIPPWL